MHRSRETARPNEETLPLMKKHAQWENDSNPEGKYNHCKPKMEYLVSTCFLPQEMHIGSSTDAVNDGHADEDGRLSLLPVPQSAKQSSRSPSSTEFGPVRRVERQIREHAWA